MELKILGSGSSGNCYLLKPKSGKGLLLECGLTFNEIKKGLDFDLNIEGCLLSHEHKSDHAKCPQEIINAGIPLYTSFGTAFALRLNNPHCLIKGDLIELGDWKFMAFDVNHDAIEPFGFLIGHPECGTIAFITDSNGVNHGFKDVNHWLIEANYSNDEMLNNLMGEKINPYLAGRICQNHMSLEMAIDILRINYSKKMRTITLIHLSESNSWPEVFKRKVAESIGIMPNIAKNGLTIEL